MRSGAVKKRVIYRVKHWGFEYMCAFIVLGYRKLYTKDIGSMKQSKNKNRLIRARYVFYSKGKTEIPSHRSSINMTDKPIKITPDVAARIIGKKNPKRLILCSERRHF